MSKQYDIELLLQDKNIILFSMLIVLLKIVFAFYLLHINPNIFFAPDSASYIQPARELLSYGTFTNHGIPELSRTPGYSFFLIPFVYLFNDNIAIPVVITQIFIVLGIALITKEIAFEISKNDIISKIIFFLVLIEPNMNILQYFILSDIVFALFLIASIYFLILSYKKGNLSHLFFGFFILSLSAFVRPISIYLVYVIGFISVPYFIRNKRGFAVILFSILLHFILINVWSVRNEIKTGAYVFSSVSSDNLYEYISASILAKAEGKGWETVRDEFRGDTKNMGLAERIPYQKKKSLEIISAYPKEAMIIGTKGFFTNIFDPGTGMLANMFSLRKSNSGIMYKFVSMPISEFTVYVLKHEKALITTMTIGVLWIIIFYISAFSGALKIERGYIFILLLVVIFYFLIISSGPQSYARFRVPVTPHMSIFAGYGIYNILHKVGLCKKE